MSEKAPNTEGRFKITPIVYLIVHGEHDSVLFVQRKNRNYSLPARHMEYGERIFDAAVRGAWRELALDINPNDMSLIHVAHIMDRDGHRIAFFVDVASWGGMPQNMAGDQHQAIVWLSQSELPEKTVSAVRRSLDFIKSGQFVSEQSFGSRWSS